MPAVVVSDATSTQIVAEDFQRTLVLISNSHATSKLHIAFGETATTDHAYVAAGGNMTLAGDRIAKCAINGLSSSGNITANYSKLSAGS